MSRGTRKVSARLSLKSTVSFFLLPTINLGSKVFLNVSKTENLVSMVFLNASSIAILGSNPLF